MGFFFIVVSSLFSFLSFSFHLIACPVMCISVDWERPNSTGPISDLHFLLFDSLADVAFLLSLRDVRIYPKFFRRK